MVGCLGFPQVGYSFLACDIIYTNFFFCLCLLSHFILDEFNWRKKSLRLNSILSGIRVVERIRQIYLHMLSLVLALITFRFLGIRTAAHQFSLTPVN